MQQRNHLARLPTPVERLHRLSDALGIELWVKRDDLTGFGLSGNKVRKLEFLMAAALNSGCDTVITTGGIQSNHARATAIAARQLGMEPVLLLRGSAPEVVESNLLLDALLGAQVHWCTAEAYRDERNAIMERIAEALRAQGRKPYVIPEGGSCGLGSLGFVWAAEELKQQVPEGFDHIVCAVGSGGTLAGLAMGPALGMVHGVAVCDDRAVFSARVRAIADEVRYLPLGIEGRDWEVVEGYQGPAYAVATPEIWDTIRWVARMEGLLLDPVYTGKAFHALVQEAKSGRWTGRVLFWHTGGAFGLFGRGAEL